MLKEEQKDCIYDCLVVGMALEDAYIVAGLTERQISECADDIDFQLWAKKTAKSHEYGLLSKLSTVIDKQTNIGKEAAITWSLEHMYPRYKGAQQTDLPSIHLHLDPTDPSEYDTVEIHRPTSDKEAQD